jgi:hypothetical protein
LLHATSKLLSAKNNIEKDKREIIKLDCILCP